MGVHQRIVLDFPAGYGFAGIAVALMGRSHPVGIVLAALLFGALHQGGAELAFEIPTITREMVVVIQGLIILFSGALVNMPRPWLQWLLASLPPLACEARCPRAGGGLMTGDACGLRPRSPLVGRTDGRPRLLVFLTLAATLRVATPLVLCAHGRAVLGEERHHRCRARGQDAGGGLLRRRHRRGHRLGLGWASPPPSSRPR